MFYVYFDIFKMFILLRSWYTLKITSSFSNATKYPALTIQILLTIYDKIYNTFSFTRQKISELIVNVKIVMSM